ncbi:TIGR02302 family protein [Rhodobacteraceae bacterium 2CG4]|uniref:TIGR02302 family protein n=1 Tax=Halovulum marinum TaxID=2662447 RepID=A0A6L5YV08_9RHOB|nr:TIGR02302 family protein [Halovulum marinum]MSU88173.1 TIGR02302 family protein [Halovulum marinum]
MQTPEDPTTTDDPIATAEARLATQIRRARRALAAERVVRGFWPVATLAMLAGAVWAFGVLAAIGPVGALAALVLLGLALLVALWRGARGFRWPTRAEAVARLDARLPGRPISALQDRIAIGANDPGTQALWARHLERMAERAAAARAARPDLRVSSRDPWALRLLALVAIIAAALFARAPAPVELAVPVGPGGPSVADIAAGPSYEAWANPPAYTGRPTVYLTEDRPRDLELPIGTEITVRVYGGEAGFALSESVSGAGAGLEPIAEGILSTTFEARRPGAFGLTQQGRELAEWQVSILPDQPPDVAFAEEVTQNVSGAMELAYSASDDYGVAGGTARITLDLDAVDRRFGLDAAPEPREALVLDLPLPLTGDTDRIDETLVEDLSRHPWSGLPVTIELQVFDAAEQTAEAEAGDVTLPGRSFFDPLARAVLEQRRDLLWNRENAPRVDMMLRTITHAPEDIFTGPTAFMLVRMALRRLGYAREDGELSAAERDDVAELLWNAALAIEDGTLSDARERLRRAQDRLSEALRNGATDDEIAQLMEELRQAMQDYMQQLAQEALRNADDMAQQDQQNQMQLSQDQLQQLLDRIQELAESGQQEQAQALLEQLRQMLENLQMQVQRGGQGQQGQQMMQELQDTLRQQQGLADDSFQELQRQFNQGQPGQQGQPQMPGQGQLGQNQPGQPGQQPMPSQPGQDGQPGLSAEQLAERQEALRQMLDGLRGRLPAPGTEEGADARERLGDAEDSMGQARDRLDEGDLSGALDRQADVMDALRDGIRGLGEEMQQAQQNQGNMGEQPGEGYANDNRDPLGRPSGARGNIRSDENMLPGVDAMQRARELFDEIRRRAGEQSRPTEELDYLRRLLDRF